MPDVIEEIPNDSAAALILIEHHWPWVSATQSRVPDRVNDGFLSSLDLIEIGRMTRAEAEELAAPFWWS